MSNVITLKPISNNLLDSWEIKQREGYTNPRYHNGFEYKRGASFYLKMLFEAVVFGGSLASILVLLILLGEF